MRKQHAIMVLLFTQFTIFILQLINGSNQKALDKFYYFIDISLGHFKSV